MIILAIKATFGWYLFRFGGFSRKIPPGYIFHGGMANFAMKKTLACCFSGINCLSVWKRPSSMHQPLPFPETNSFKWWILSTCFPGASRGDIHLKPSSRLLPCKIRLPEISLAGKWWPKSGERRNGAVFLGKLSRDVSASLKLTSIFCHWKWS